MYLKSLTLKGFKSFADPTTLDLEPGVTVVVGPNGSGKSNVVDAVAWVLGTQGPSVVRSQKMDDVIFAGTAQRAALGRAEVTLVVDNTSRRLPADLNEVTIRRTLFRNGDSEYTLNGVECRLLDIQELLSDSGVGRQQHVIISQGQLDAILSARPEDRRTSIEEAAGILKYRRRRERAVRRLEAAETSLVRLGDLLREVRRQIRPLERQAASAERHGALTDELHALSLVLAAAEIRALRLERSEGNVKHSALGEQERSLLDKTNTLGAQIEAAESRIGADPADRLVPLRSRAERLTERARGVAALLQSREHARVALARALDEAAGVASLVETRDRLGREIAGTESTGTMIAAEWEHLARDESDLVAGEARHSERFGAVSRDASEAAAVKRAEVARRTQARDIALHQHQATRERTAALVERRETYLRRATAAAERFGSIGPLVASGAADVARLAAVVVDAERAKSVAERSLAVAREARAGLLARSEALDLALSELRSRTGASRLGALDGVLGPLVDLVEVEGAFALAFEAAAHTVLDATVFADASSARAALLSLQRSASTGAVLVAGGGRRPEAVSSPLGATWLTAHVRARRSDVSELVAALFDGVAVVDGDLDAALAILGNGGVRSVVTTSGDVFSHSGWRIGAGRAGATLDALDRTTEQLIEIESRLHEAERIDHDAERFLAQARAACEHAEGSLETLVDEQRQIEAEQSELAVALELLEVEEHASSAQLADAATALMAAESELAAEQADLDRREHDAVEEQRQAEEARIARENLDDRARALSALRRDLEVRSASLEERRGQLAARSAELTEEIERRNAATVDADQQRLTLEREQTAAAALEGELADTLAALEATRANLDAVYESRRARAAVELERIATFRREREQATAAIETARVDRQRLEIELAQLEVREEAAVSALRRELDVGPEEALAAPMVELAEGVSATDRRAALDKELRELGPVNLLAKEELDALTERSGFLESQIADAQNARRELNGVIRAVDSEITDIFAAAFADVARNFEILVTTLFPGGSGRLTLTSPDDLLETGVEIEARPAGRTIRRLSLLSGGERSLVALAFLFAIFRSRPSPFYLMDEVEAALDEVNLARFLALLDEFRDEAQLIVVSHQKRTMEIADALYGVTMQPGGASKVVSERLRGRVGEATATTDARS